MGIQETHNALSIATRIRERTEKRASGAEPASFIRLSPQTNSRIMTNGDPNQDTRENLSGEFLNLLLSPEKENQNTLTPEKVFIESHRNFGTKPLTSSLNKQEGSKQHSTNEREPFSLVVQNSELGAIELSGKWIGSKLFVQLKLPNSLPAHEEKILCAMLSKGLSAQLAVSLEISIA